MWTTSWRPLKESFERPAKPRVSLRAWGLVMSARIRLRWRAAAGAVHLVIFALSLWAAYLLRFDFFIPHWERPLFYRGLLLVAFLKPAIFYLLRMDREQWWSHVGMS